MAIRKFRCSRARRRSDEGSYPSPSQGLKNTCERATRVEGFLPRVRTQARGENIERIEDEEREDGKRGYEFTMALCDSFFPLFLRLPFFLTLPLFIVSNSAPPHFPSTPYIPLSLSLTISAGKLSGYATKLLIVAKLL